MLLGLTILLVLLAWTLGNTIARSTKLSTLDAHTDRSFHDSFVLRLARYLRSKRPIEMLCVHVLLRHIEMQPALALQSPLGDAAATVATTSNFSESFASLIGRTLVGYCQYPGFAARDSYKSALRSPLRMRGLVG